MVPADHPHPERAFIQRLPDEILEHILTLAAIDPYWFYKRNNSRQDLIIVKKLALVCRRFSGIALPLLYRTVSVELDPGDKSLARLHAAIQTNPMFQNHCHILNIRITDIYHLPSEYFPLLNDLISFLPKVRSLTFNGGYDNNPQETWGMIRLASRNMPAVRSLDLSRVCGGLYLRDVSEHIDFMSLQALRLSGVHRPRSPSERGFVLDPKKHRTAAFTSLSLSDYEESPEATEQLLQWPTGLVHFHFDSFYNNPFYMDLPMFGKWLSVHRDTLRSISIGYLSPYGRGLLFDAAAFPKLEVLALSTWQLAQRREKPESTFSFPDAELILGPNLHTFGLDFSIYDQHSEAWGAFGDPEENWLREFANFAIARKAKLRRIEINFTPESYGFHKQEGYPWDRMDKIHREIRPHGLVLEYNKPNVTRSDWIYAHCRDEELCATYQDETPPGGGYGHDEWIGAPAADQWLERHEGEEPSVFEVDEWLKAHEKDLILGI